jgi:hypothetical protein
MKSLFAVILIAFAPMAFAQDTVITSPIDGSTTILTTPDVAASSVRAIQAPGATLRGLDKVSGEVIDLELFVGETAAFGRIEVTLGECRYPEDNPMGEAYAWLEIEDPLRTASVFEGWMVASSPALNALDHARYDVWVIRCTTA